MNATTVEPKSLTRHSHVYAIAPNQAASTVITTAEEDAASFWGDHGDLSPEAEEFSSPEVKVAVDESGGTYAYWVQAGASSEEPFKSNANSINSEDVNLYVLASPYPSATEVRAALDKAEADAKSYAEANDLEFTAELVRLTATGDNVVIMWSTESE